MENPALRRQRLAEKLYSSIENLYNMPGKPKTARDVNYEDARNRIEEVIKKDGNVSKQDIIIIISNLKNIAKVSPSTKDQMDLVIKALNQHIDDNYKEKDDDEER